MSKWNNSAFCNYGSDITINYSTTTAAPTIMRCSVISIVILDYGWVLRELKWRVMAVLEKESRACTNS